MQTASTLPAGVSPLAILHVIVWLIHAVVQAFATALVDVFTSMTTALIILGVVVLAGTGLASAFGLGGFSLFRRWRKRE